MRECLQCLVDVIDERWTTCPTCGGLLREIESSPEVITSPGGSPASNRAQVSKIDTAPAAPLPFIGRKKKLAALRQFLQGSGLDGPPRAHVVGSTGIGKTRFVSEALKELEETHEAIWWTCQPMGQSMALAPLIHWLHQELELPPIHNPRLLSRAIREYLARVS